MAKLSIKRLFPFLFPKSSVPAANAPVSVRVDDSKGWESGTYAPNDRTWGEVYSDLEDA